MRKINDFIEAARLENGPLPSTRKDGMNGFFVFNLNGFTLRSVASNGRDWKECGFKGKPWEHVSVSLVDRCPTWDEMAFIKDTFWNENECVVEFHPPKSSYINFMPYCLHLWKPIGVSIPMPPSMCVGPEVAKEQRQKMFAKVFLR